MCAHGFGEIFSLILWACPRTGGLLTETLVHHLTYGPRNISSMKILKFPENTMAFEFCSRMYKNVSFGCSEASLPSLYHRWGKPFIDSNADSIYFCFGLRSSWDLGNLDCGRVDVLKKQEFQGFRWLMHGGLSHGSRREDYIYVLIQRTNPQFPYWLVLRISTNFLLIHRKKRTKPKQQRRKPEQRWSCSGEGLGWAFGIGIS